MRGSTSRPRRRTRLLLWLVALIVTLGAAVYQRLTGPSHPVEGSIEVAGRSLRYELPRSHLTTSAATIDVPDPEAPVSAVLYYKRYQLDEPLQRVEMRRADGRLVAELPAQPPAGKLEYFITLHALDRLYVIPDRDEGNVVIRFRDPVPAVILVPHITLMFLSLLLGARTGLSALFTPGEARRLAWITLAGMTLGGMILGPIAQNLAFGAYWAGFPFGYDLTDNKVLIMWIVWLVACAVIGTRVTVLTHRQRAVVGLAAVLMLGVYAIPHSTWGSQLDYELLEQGVPPSEAIKTGSGN